jgi:hypothetical protein
MNHYALKLNEMAGNEMAARLMRWARRARKISIKAQSNTWTANEIRWADRWITDHVGADCRWEALAMLAVLYDEFDGRMTINLSEATGHFLTVDDYREWVCEDLILIWGSPNNQLVFA